MPASICDPVSSALRLSLSAGDESQSSSLLDSRLYSSAKNVLLSKIEFEESGDYQSNVLDGLKSKYVVIRPKKPVLDGKIIKKEGNNSNYSAENIKKIEEGLPKPKRVLFPVENVQLGWQSSWAAGAGMQNVGNTCYLNSTLQALFHVPAFANWLVTEGSHADKCNQQEACIICGMRATLLATQKSGGAPIKPWQVYSKLRLICRHLTPGRQEDAHEFLRYLVEAMEKCYLTRFVNAEKLDQYSKESTPLNQILGGYLRSTVRCLSCQHLSTTYQHFQDLLLDIRKHSTLDEALDSFFSRERLEDLGYKCEGCNKKVSATKQFFIERAPMVLCIALKRFSLVGGKLSKHVQFRKKISLNKYIFSKNNNQQLSYKLVSLVTHLGPSQNCGHYTAIGQAPNSNYYQFDDSCVRPVPLSAVLGTNGYIMFFEKDNTVEESSGPIATTSSTVYGPQLPANHILNRDKSPLKLTIYRNDEKKPLILNNNSTKLVKPEVKPIILNSTLSNPSENSNTAEPWILKQNGDIEKVQPPKILNGIDKPVKIDEDKKLSFVIKRPIGDENGHLKAKLSKSDSELRAIGSGTKLLDRSALMVKSKGSKSPLEKLEEQMNKSASPAKNGGSKEEKDESREKSESPNTSLSSMSPLSDRSDHHNHSGNQPNGISNKQEANTNGKSGIIINGKCSVTNGVNGKNNFANAKIVISNVNGKTERKETDNSGSSATGNSMLGSYETVRQLQSLSHRGYGAPITTWNGTHSNISRQVTEERVEQRKRARDATDEMDRGRNKKTRKFQRYPQYGRAYNPFQEKQSKGVWGAWQRERRPPHRHHNKYRRFNRYNNGHHYPRHH